ncbi:MAG: hypothetical protein M3063_05465, partial [Actinomycetota bacterium]|nr:hypothetical protein [Actinomycetota bacterium]
AAWSGTAVSSINVVLAAAGLELTAKPRLKVVDESRAERERCCPAQRWYRFVPETGANRYQR